VLAIIRRRNIFLHSSFLSKNINTKIYRNIILSVVLHECETWTLTMREERKLRLIENRVLRKIFGPNRDDVSKERIRLQNEKLYCLYFSSNIIRVIK